MVDTDDTDYSYQRDLIKECKIYSTTVRQTCLIETHTITTALY